MNKELAAKISQKRQAELLEIVEGKTRDEIVAGLPKYAKFTIINDLYILVGKGVLRHEKGPDNLHVYYKSGTHLAGEVIASSPIATWGGYGAKPVTQECRQYAVEDFEREYPLRPSRKAHISCGILESAF